MNRRTLMTLATAMALGVPLLSGAAAAQGKPVCETRGVVDMLPSSVVQACESLKARLLGTWELVAYERVFQDGRRVELMGPAPKGIVVFDPAGHFALTLARSNLPESDRTAVTADEAKAIAEGMQVSYGTFTLIDNGYIRQIRLDAELTIGNTRGVLNRADIKSFTSEELEFRISRPYGEATRLAWKRAK